MQDIYTGIVSALGIPELIFYGAMAVLIIIMLIHYAKSEKPVRTALCGMLSGTAALLLLNHFGGDVSFLPEIPLNGFTAFTALTLGIPGVAAMAVISLIM